jgi:hypothetical protein
VFKGFNITHYKIKSFNKKINCYHILEILFSTDDEKSRIRYFGRMHNGIPNGYGTMTWKDGQIYRGTKTMKSMMHF